MSVPQPPAGPDEWDRRMRAWLAAVSRLTEAGYPTGGDQPPVPETPPEQPERPGPDRDEATVFGYNVRGGAPDSAFQSLAGRRAAFGGRVPVVRFYQMKGQQPAFEVTPAHAPEKRVAHSFKANGRFTQAQLAAGDAHDAMVSWLNSIPAGWTVWWTYHHEPQDEFHAGTLDPELFVQTYHRMRLALDAATLAPGTRVYSGPCFLAFELTGPGWSDSWVPPRSDCDIQLWDIYGNPGNNTTPSGSNAYGGPGTGIAYGTTYPPVDARFAPMFAIIERTGYADSWGLLEFNAPGRDWDTSEAGRVAWHRHAVETLLFPPMRGHHPPKVVVLWENTPISSAKWDQSYGRAGGDGSPMVDFWSPYITGSP